MLHLEYFLILSALMLFIGIYGFLTRRSTLAVLISVELMLNASDINFAVFNRLLYPAGQEGYFFALFSIAISAAETAVAIAIMIAINAAMVILTRMSFLRESMSPKGMRKNKPSA